MIQDIKNYFFFRRLKEETIVNRKNLLLQEFSLVKTIGIAYDASDFEMITTVRDLENNLSQNGKSVTVFGYIDSDEKKYEPFLFTKKDLNWYGYPTKQQLFDFASKDFDLVLGFFNELNSPLNAIFANSKSKLRLGVNFNQDSDLFDIILGTSKLKGKKDIVTILMNFIKSINTQ